MFNQYEHAWCSWLRAPNTSCIAFQEWKLSWIPNIRSATTLDLTPKWITSTAHPFHVSWISGIKPITGSYSSPRAISFDFVPSSNGSPHTKAVMSIQYICALFSESSTEMDVIGCCTICCQCTRSHEAMHSTQCVPLKRVRADVNWFIAPYNPDYSLTFSAYITNHSRPLITINLSLSLWETVKRNMLVWATQLQHLQVALFVSAFLFHIHIFTFTSEDIEYAQTSHLWWSIKGCRVRRYICSAVLLDLWSIFFFYILV